MDRWHCMFERESGKFVCAAIENWVRRNEDSSRSRLNQFRKDGLEIVPGFGVEDLQLESEGAGRGLDAFQNNVAYDRIGGINEY
jgi:hypothetical protein